MNRQRCLVFCFIFTAFHFCLSISLFAQDIIHDWGRAGKPKLVKYGLAIPSFLPKEGKAIKKGTFSSIILNDLEISGIFKKVKNDKFVEQQRQTDLRAKKIDFIEWGRLSASLLVLGEYTFDGEEISVRCDVYDVPSQAVVYRKKYNAESSRFRLLAHSISDDIIRYYAAGRVGIARTKILYVSNSHEPTKRDKKEIYVMDADGENKVRLTYDSSVAATPCWGANSTEFYYTSDRNYNFDLYGQYLSKKGNWVVSRRPGFNLSPNFSSSNSKITLMLGKDGNLEIYTMDRDGKSLKRLTYGKAIDCSPSFSPSGDHILFTSDRTGRPQIHMMDADGFNQRRITFQGSYNVSAAWSPKEDRIALTARSQGRQNIYTMDTNGRKWVQLTGISGDEGDNEDPSWAPDGETLSFTSDRTGRPQIYIMNIRDGKVRQLTRKGFNTSSAWSPLLYK